MVVAEWTTCDGLRVGAWISVFIDLRHRFQIVAVSARPHVSGFVAFSKVSTLETVFKSLLLLYTFSPDTCGRITATKCLRIQTNSDTCGRGHNIMQVLVKCLIKNTQVQYLSFHYGEQHK